MMKFVLQSWCQSYSSSTPPRQRVMDCGICLEVIKTPFTLNCGHVYCKDCTEPFFSSEGLILCPSCGRISRRDDETRNVKIATTSNRIEDGKIREWMHSMRGFKVTNEKGYRHLFLSGFRASEQKDLRRIVHAFGWVESIRSMGTKSMFVHYARKESAQRAKECLLESNNGIRSTLRVEQARICGKPTRDIYLSNVPETWSQDNIYQWYALDVVLSLYLSLSGTHTHTHTGCVCTVMSSEFHR
jgi:uncharacterized Zn finger protein (UPF0148 family)